MTGILHLLQRLTTWSFYQAAWSDITAVMPRCLVHYCLSRHRPTILTKSFMTLFRLFNVAESTAHQQIAQAVGAMDENISGNQSLVNYYPLFILFGATEEDVMSKVDEFKKISAQFGISPVVEDFASKVSWFAQIPGFDVFPRSFKMLSKTASISIPMSSTPRGVANSDWGPGPLVVFPTAQGTPYMFQFHVSDKPAAVAHTLTIGPTGGGKTTLFSFLIAQSLR